jgi:hypothetical protein
MLHMHAPTALPQRRTAVTSAHGRATHAVACARQHTSCSPSQPEPRTAVAGTYTRGTHTGQTHQHTQNTPRDPHPCTNRPAVANACLTQRAQATNKQGPTSCWLQHTTDVAYSICNTGCACAMHAAQATCCHTSPAKVATQKCSAGCSGLTALQARKLQQCHGVDGMACVGTNGSKEFTQPRATQWRTVAGREGPVAGRQYKRARAGGGDQTPTHNSSTGETLLQRLTRPEVGHTPHGVDTRARG